LGSLSAQSSHGRGEGWVPALSGDLVACRCRPTGNSRSPALEV